MNMIYSKITSKSQTVIPRVVREKLGLKPGDRVRYALTPNGVVLDKAIDGVEDDPFAVFTEWASEADENAYGNL